MKDKKHHRKRPTSGGALGGKTLYSSYTTATPYEKKQIVRKVANFLIERENNVEDKAFYIELYRAGPGDFDTDIDKAPTFFQRILEWYLVAPILGVIYVILSIIPGTGVHVDLFPSMGGEIENIMTKVADSGASAAKAVASVAPVEVREGVRGAIASAKELGTAAATSEGARSALANAKEIATNVGEGARGALASAKELGASAMSAATMENASAAIAKANAMGADALNVADSVVGQAGKKMASVAKAAEEAGKAVEKTKQTVTDTVEAAAAAGKEIQSTITNTTAAVKDLSKNAQSWANSFSSKLKRASRGGAAPPGPQELLANFPARNEPVRTDNIFRLVYPDLPKNAQEIIDNADKYIQGRGATKYRAALVYLTAPTDKVDEFIFTFYNPITNTAAPEEVITRDYADFGGATLNVQTFFDNILKSLKADDDSPFVTRVLAAARARIKNIAVSMQEVLENTEHGRRAAIIENQVSEILEINAAAAAAAGRGAAFGVLRTVASVIPQTRGISQIFEKGLKIGSTAANEAKDLGILAEAPPPKYTMVQRIYKVYLAAIVNDIAFTPRAVQILLAVCIIAIAYSMYYSLSMIFDVFANISFKDGSAVPLNKNTFNYTVASRENQWRARYPFAYILVANFIALQALALAFVYTYRRLHPNWIFAFILPILVLARFNAMKLWNFEGIKSSTYLPVFLATFYFAIIPLFVGACTVPRAHANIYGVTWTIFLIVGIQIIISLIGTFYYYSSAYNEISQAAGSVGKFNNFVYDRIYKNTAFLNDLMTDYNPYDVEASIQRALDNLPKEGISTVEIEEQSGDLYQTLMARINKTFGLKQPIKVRADTAKVYFTLNLFKTLAATHNAEALKMFLPANIVLRSNVMPSDYLLNEGVYINDYSTDYSETLPLNADAQGILLGYMSEVNNMANSFTTDSAIGPFITMSVGVTIFQWMPVLLVLVVLAARRRYAAAAN